MISICLMRWLRQPWRSSSTRSQPSEKDWVSKSRKLRIPTDSYEEDKLRTWSMSISVQPKLVTQHKDSQTWSVWLCDVRWYHALWSVSEMPSDPILEGLYKSKITECRSTSDCDGFVWLRSCSEKWDTERSTIEDCSETSYLTRWWEIGISKLGTMLWKGVQSPRVEKETKRMLRGKWESAFSGFRHDPLLAFGNKSSGNSQRWKGRSSSPASHAEAKQTDGEEQKPSQWSGNKHENSKDKSEIHADSDSVKIRLVGSGILPCVWTTSLIKVVSMPINVVSDMLRQMESPTRSRRKVVRKDQLRIPRFLSEQIYSTWTWNVGIDTHRQILQRHLAPNLSSAKKGSIARCYPTVCTSWAQSLRARIRG